MPRQPRYRPSRKAAPTLYDLTPERAIQDAQEDAAGRLGWFYWHVVRSDQAAIHPGLPDTLLLGPRLGRPGSQRPVLYLLENKVESESPTPVQQEALELLGRVEAPPQVRLVRPSTWDAVLAELQRRTR